MLASDMKRGGSGGNSESGSFFDGGANPVDIRQHTSAYVSIRHHTSASESGSFFYGGANPKYTKTQIHRHRGQIYSSSMRTHI